MHLKNPINGHLCHTAGRELAALGEASRVLAEATSLDEITQIRNKAEAARSYAKAAQLGLDIQNRATELRLRAERKAGSFLAALKLRGGDRKSKSRSDSLKLEDLGITRNQSKRWQRIASFPEDRFCQYLQRSNELGLEVTSTSLLRALYDGRSRKRQSYTTSNGSSTNSRSQSAALARESNLAEVAQEMMNHCQLLSELLQPIYEGREHSFKSAERSVIGHLIDEIKELITHIQRL